MAPKPIIEKSMKLMTDPFGGDRIICQQQLLEVVIVNFKELCDYSPNKISEYLEANIDYKLDKSIIENIGKVVDRNDVVIFQVPYPENPNNGLMIEVLTRKYDGKQLSEKVNALNDFQSDYTIPSVLN